MQLKHIHGEVIMNILSTNFKAVPISNLELVLLERPAIDSAALLYPS
jgi:hypothetical protein